MKKNDVSFTNTFAVCGSDSKINQLMKASTSSKPFPKKKQLILPIQP